MSKTIKVDYLGRLHLIDFKEFLDISKVVFYSFKQRKDKTLILKFYDKKKKVIKLSVQK